MEWNVLEEKTLPLAAEESRPRRYRAYLLLALLLLAGTVGGGLWLRQRAAANEAARHADIRAALVQEERALRFAVVEQAASLADPAAPAAWQLRYRAAFDGAQAALPEPEVTAIAQQGELALVTLRYGSGAGAWQMVRAYRQVGRAWRRTPVPATASAPGRAYHSSHFTLHLSEAEAALLPPDELLAFLEEFRTRFASAWQIVERPHLAIHFVPEDSALPALPSNSPDVVRLTSPLLALPEWSALSPSRSYRLSLAQGVAAALAPPDPGGGAEGAALRFALREALVRHITLSPAEQEAFLAHLPTAPEGAGTLAPRTVAHLAAYLLALEGAGAPARLAGATFQSTDLAAATIQSFGIRLRTLLHRVALWEEVRAAAPRHPDSDALVLLRVLGDSPFRALVVRERDGTLLTVQAAGEGPPLPLTCLGPGSRLRAEGGDESDPTQPVGAIAIESLRLPGWTVAPLPTGARTLVAERRAGSTRIVALDDASGRVLLAALPGEIELLPRPGEPAFAFLYHDHCGSTVSVYNPARPEIARVPVTPRGEPHLFWEGQWFLLDDRSAETRPLWEITPLQEGEWGATLHLLLPSPIRWRKLLGYSAATGSYLVADAAGEPWWLAVTRTGGGRVAHLRPAALPLPPDATHLALSPDGSELLYSAPAAGGAGLFALPLGEKHSTLLYRSGGEAEVAALVVAPDRFAVAGVLRGAGEGAGDWLFQVTRQQDQVITRVDRFGAGTVRAPFWCSGGRLLYELVRGGAPLLVEGVTSNLEVRAGAGVQPLGCFPP